MSYKDTEQKPQIRVLHNASIISAVCTSGLSVYIQEVTIQAIKFGETVSIVFWTENWQPDSFYDKILSNKRRGLHTLCLLDGMNDIIELNSPCVGFARIAYKDMNFKYSTLEDIGSYDFEITQNLSSLSTKEDFSDPPKPSKRIKTKAKRGPAVDFA
ncbi:diphthine methyl ester synthase-like, partial [Octopus sinensis]|uniref:Diphthine methyl ester synthase-like n=1 Tax=Octopus sinensis TaxID=2607531 RepID=A0A6P7TZ06_9MOLL